ncbi:hypothetical protein D3C77_721870 [compost metagenome]
MHHDLPGIAQPGGFAQGCELFHGVFPDDISVVSEGVLVDVGKAHAALEGGFVHMQEDDLGLRGNRFCQFDGAQR